MALIAIILLCYQLIEVVEGICQSLYDFVGEIILEPHVELSLSHVKGLESEVISEDYCLHYA